jgi:hypothetical protein
MATSDWITWDVVTWFHNIGLDFRCRVPPGFYNKPSRKLITQCHLALPVKYFVSWDTCSLYLTRYAVPVSVESLRPWYTFLIAVLLRYGQQKTVPTCTSPETSSPQNSWPELFSASGRHPRSKTLSLPPTHATWRPWSQHLVPCTSQLWLPCSDLVLHSSSTPGISPSLWEACLLSSTGQLSSVVLFVLLPSFWSFLSSFDQINES